MKTAILNNAANFLYFNINFSKYLENFFHEIIFLNCDKFIESRFKKAFCKTAKYKKNYVIIDYYNKDSEIIKYFSRIYGEENQQKLIDFYNKEYSKSLEYFKNETFDYVIFLNGVGDVEVDVCRELKIKTFFFEHGYVPNTIQMDTKGVNSNASFAKLSYPELINFSYQEDEFLPYNEFIFKELKYSMLTRYLYRLSDSRYNSFLKGYIRKKKNISKAGKRFSSFEFSNIDFIKNEKFIFFPLQVNSDTQIVLNSRYSSMYNVLEEVLPKLVNTGYKVILKEHPMETEPVSYDAFIDNKNVFLVQKANLDELIEKSEFVVNVNSSVGFQAIKKYKKVLLLGESFYWNSPISKSIREIPENKILEEFEKITIDKSLIDNYINIFEQKIFIPGHFYKPTIEFFERIRNRLV